MGRARSRVSSEQRPEPRSLMFPPWPCIRPSECSRDLLDSVVYMYELCYTAGVMDFKIPSSPRSGGSGERCVSRLFTVRFYAPFLSPPCGEEPEGDVTGRVLGIAQNPVSCTQDTCIQCPSPCVRLLRSQADHLSLVQLPGRAAQESASERSWIPKNARGTTHVGI